VVQAIVEPDERVHLPQRLVQILPCENFAGVLHELQEQGDGLRL